MESINRQQAIHDKGFNFGPKEVITEYGTINVGGVKILDNATLDLDSLKSKHPNYTNKSYIEKAIADCNVSEMRNISNYFYRVSGIYRTACNYLATLYRYDWYIVPEIYDDKLEEDKIVKEFVRILNYLDNSYIKKTCGEIALDVVKNGVYYGYVVPDAKDGIVIQELPVGYCRSRYNVGNRPAVEFNMKFFDEKFPDIKYRLKVLQLFPPEFQEGYILYKQGKLEKDYSDEMYGGWYLLDPKCTVKFSFGNGDTPWFINAIPSIIDLDAAQELDRRKQMQKLLKILIQKLPLDKNGDLIFDVDEAADIHNNMVQMLRNTFGVDVVTTFADVDDIDLSDNTTSTSTDELEKVERTTYNNMGLASNLFNADGNIALSQSVLVDESSIRSLLYQFAVFYDTMTQQKTSNRRKYNFRLYMLETTQHNYKDLSKMYKEQVQIGYSKMLPQIALGHSQSAIINTAHFENEVLHLSEIMIPPLMSSTMSSEDILGKNSETTTSKVQNTSEGSSGGRPEKDDAEKSDKTLQNRESMS